MLFFLFLRARVSGSKVQEDGCRATGNFVVVLSLHEGVLPHCMPFLRVRRFCVVCTELRVSPCSLACVEASTSAYKVQDLVSRKPRISENTLNDARGP